MLVVGGVAFFFGFGEKRNGLKCTLTGRPLAVINGNQIPITRVK